MNAVPPAAAASSVWARPAVKNTICAESTTVPSGAMRAATGRVLAPSTHVATNADPFQATAAVAPVDWDGGTGRGIGRPFRPSLSSRTALTPPPDEPELRPATSRTLPAPNASRG